MSTFVHKMSFLWYMRSPRGWKEELKYTVLKKGRKKGRIEALTFTPVYFHSHTNSVEPVQGPKTNVASYQLTL